jgi:hypothetical protein
MKGRRMFGFIWRLVAQVHYATRRFMPTNLVLTAIHTRRGLKWGIPAMLIAVPCAFGAAYCVRLVEDGASGWLNLLALLLVWDALKLVAAGPATLIRLLSARHREARARWQSNFGLNDLGDPHRAGNSILHSHLSDESTAGQALGGSHLAN